MQVDGNTLTIGKAVWIQHGGVDVEEGADSVRVTARDEDSYLKVLNHFGRVLKLYVFEGGQWVDADTGVSAQPFDEAQAGHLPSPSGAPAPPAAKSKSARAKKPTRPVSVRPAAQGKEESGKQKSSGRAPKKAPAKADGRAAKPKPSARKRGAK